MSTETHSAALAKALSLFALSVRIVGVLLSAATITSCSKSSPTEPVLQDSVTIVSIQPPAGTTLQAGAPVTFTAAITYHLASAPSGSVAILIADQLGRNLSTTVPQPQVPVANGTGTVVLTDQVVLPSSGVATVLVLFPLFATGNTSTQTFQSASYPVSYPAIPATYLGQARGVHHGVADNALPADPIRSPLGLMLLRNSWPGPCATSPRCASSRPP